MGQNDNTDTTDFYFFWLLRVGSATGADISGPNVTYKQPEQQQQHELCPQHEWKQVNVMCSLLWFVMLSLLLLLLLVFAFVEPVWHGLEPDQFTSQIPIPNPTPTPITHARHEPLLCLKVEHLHLSEKKAECNLAGLRLPD